MLVFGLSFVVALNVAARLNEPDFQDLVVVDDYNGPGAAINVRRTYNLGDFQEAVYTQNLDRLRLVSIISVIGLALGSGIGGYVLSGMMLRPVRDIQKVASEISATNLSRRINHQGPDDELKALADTFDSMIDRLEHSFEQQRQFVQDASHELRTPLAAIRTNIEVAEMDPSISEEEYRSLLETIKAQTARLTRLSEDLLLLSANERETPPLEPVALTPLAKDVARQLMPLAANRDTELRVAGDVELLASASPDLLFRAVFNLVDNAIKYSGEGNMVTIRVSEAPGDRVQIAVQDLGPGISPEQQPLIFERFYRIDRGRSRREGGTGLGLPIVKELVQCMGGTIHVESEPGRGSTFVITLDRTDGDETEPAIGARTPGRTPGESASASDDSRTPGGLHAGFPPAS